MKWHRTLAQNRCSMARSPKPWFRKSRKEWCVTIDKVLHRLGPDKDAAMQKFHSLMCKPKDKPVSRDAVVLLLDAFLDYVQNHNTPKTYRYYHDFAQSFCKSIPKTITVGQLRPYHVQTWVDSHKNWSQSTKRGGIVTVKRTMRWAVKQGYIDSSPIAYMEKPEIGRREKMVSAEGIQSHRRKRERCGI